MGDIYYRSYRIIDNKPKWVITDEDGNIIRNPTKEQRKLAILEDSYVHKKNKLKGRICCRCQNNKTYTYPDGTIQWHDCSCNKDNCTGYLCHNCWCWIQYNTSEGYINMIKTGSKFRTGNLDKNTETGKSIIDQAVIAYVLKIEDLNIKMDNFRYYIDMRHDIHGKIDVKGSGLISKNLGCYNYDIWFFNNRNKLDCDTYVCIGYNKDRKNIEMVWIIPNEKYIINRTAITIIKNSIKRSRYREFQVDPNPYNTAYKDLMSYLGDKNVFGIEDIKKWLSIKNNI